MRQKFKGRSSFPFRGKVGMGMGVVTLAVLGTVLTFPFKGKDGMGVVTLATLGTVFTSPFKGEAGRGMGRNPVFATRGRSRPSAHCRLPPQAGA